MSYPLNSEDIRFLRRHFAPHILELSKNETILRRSQEEGSVALLMDGLVYLCTENEQFSRSILRFFRPGEFFSGNILLPPEYGVSYLLAKVPSRLAFFRRESLLRFSLASPEWQKKLDGLLENSFLSHCFLLHQRTTRARLMQFFREESVIQHSSTIRLPIPYTDLADYLAVDRTAMMKELKKMKEERLIEGKQRILKVHPEKSSEDVR